ncbi:MAG: YdcF family protein [Phycisphaerales bacterium]|nr:YdcF family protein [Phycisphaerales bacterium]
MTTISGVFASLSKTLLLPPGSPLLLSLVGILLLRWRPRLGLGLLVVGTVLGYGLSIPFTASLLVTSLQPYPPLAESIPPAEAIVVLGGGLRDDAPEYGHGPTAHDYTLGRIRYAAWLARRTGLPILATGGSPKPGDPSEAELMRAILEREFGVGPILTETASRDTWENAVNSAKLLHERRIGTILLVSNAIHLPRATRAFTMQGLHVIPAPTLLFDDRPDLLDFQSWLPSVGASAEIRYACYEWLGQLWYTLRGYFNSPDQSP